MTVKVNTTNVSKNEYTNYLNKGCQFYDVMKICLQDKEWDAVLLNGVHAAITLNDALLVFLIGKRSIAKAHQDTVRLLIQACPTSEGRKNAARLSEILNKKHLVEYEPQCFTADEAYSFARKIDRFADWVLNQLPKNNP